MKVLKNFSCNGVKKKVGQTLTEEEKEKIGQEFGKDLLKNDFLQRESESKESSEDEDSEDDDSEDEMDLDSMDKNQLLEKAKSLGLSPHGASKEPKLREMILEKMTE